jgi:hypothetical protein
MTVHVHAFASVTIFLPAASASGHGFVSQFLELLLKEDFGGSKNIVNFKA